MQKLHGELSLKTDVMKVFLVNTYGRPETGLPVS
jgi:hypothetical protein